MHPHEDFAGPNGDVAERLCIVDWRKRHDFRKAMLTDVRTEFVDHQTAIRRSLPEAHPEFPWLFAESADLVDAKGYPDVVDGKFIVRAGTGQYAQAQQTLIDGKAIIRVVYRDPRFSVLSDTEAAGVVFAGVPAGELSRFCRRSISIASEATQIGGSAFQFVQNVPVGPIHPQYLGTESPAKILCCIEYTLTWCYVPGIPPIANFADKPPIGRVNDRTFDWQSPFGPLSKGLVLFHGCNVSDYYRTASGTKVYDVEFKFLIRPPKGWNFYFRRTARAFVEVTSDGAPRQLNEPGVADGERPYDSHDFSKLFTIE